jgi:hypothetical protein
VDTQPFSVNIVELASKKSWFNLNWPIKAKAKTSSSVILARRMVHEEWLLRRLQARRLIRLEAPGGKGDRVADQSSLSRVSWTSRYLCPDSLEPTRTIWLTQSNGLAATRGHNVHTPSSINIPKLVRQRKNHLKLLVN